jgi:hypothetical protein
MSINITVMPTEAPAVIWLEDGSSVTADPQQEQTFQLPSGSFCTISSTAGNEESDEHPPINGEAFAEAMIDFWKSVINKMRQPEATPL